MSYWLERSSIAPSIPAVCTKPSSLPKLRPRWCRRARRKWVAVAGGVARSSVAIAGCGAPIDFDFIVDPAQLGGIPARIGSPLHRHGAHSMARRTAPARCLRRVDQDDSLGQQAGKAA